MKGLNLHRRHFSIEMKGWRGWPIEIMFYRVSHRRLTWRVKVVFKVPDVATGESDYFGSDRVVVFFSRTITREKVREIVKELVLYQMEHEIEECLMIDGKRAFPDPHRKRRKR